MEPRGRRRSVAARAGAARAQGHEERKQMLFRWMVSRRVRCEAAIVEEVVGPPLAERGIETTRSASAGSPGAG